MKMKTGIAALLLGATALTFSAFIATPAEAYRVKCNGQGYVYDKGTKKAFVRSSMGRAVVRFSKKFNTTCTAISDCIPERYKSTNGRPAKKIPGKKPSCS